jgi:phosphoribosylformylglycinamidine cyclo-ligase
MISGLSRGTSISLPSTGLHTNGYSLARKLFFEVAGYRPDTFVPELGATVADELLKVHRSYLRPIRALADAKLLRGAAHITGGGTTDNTPRMLPDGLGIAIDTSSWEVPPVFQLLRKLGNIPDDDWRRTFNLGVGMILAVPRTRAAKAAEILIKLREEPWQIGEVVTVKRGRPRVEYR